MPPLSNATSSSFTPQPVPSCSGRHSRSPTPAWPRRRPSPRTQAEPDDAPRVPRPPVTDTLAPSLSLSRVDVVETQLKALQENNTPTMDAGVEVLYRFAGFDPWQRSTYFQGVSLDLGQSARFIRIFYTPPFITLINHTYHEIISTLEVDEDTWKARVYVRNDLRKGEENVYEFTLKQRLGGKYDGFWFTEHLMCDGADKRDLYGVI